MLNVQILEGAGIMCTVMGISVWYNRLHCFHVQAKGFRALGLEVIDMLDRELRINVSLKVWPAALYVLQVASLCILSWEVCGSHCFHVLLWEKEKQCYFELHICFLNVLQVLWRGHSLCWVIPRQLSTRWWPILGKLVLHCLSGSLCVCLLQSC